MRLLTTIFLLFSFLIVPLVFVVQDAEAAAGIRLPSQEARTFFFEPGEEYEWTWSIYGDSELDAYLGGDLEEHAYIEDSNPGGGPRDVTFGLQLPQTLEPGSHSLLLYAEESRPEGAMVGGVARVGGRITIISLFEGPYMDADLTVQDTGVGETTQSSLALTSWSQQSITGSATIRVYDNNNTLVHEQTTSSVTLEPRERNTITTDLQINDFEPGRYRTVAHVEGGQDNLTAQNGFLIGQFDVTLLSNTQELRPDAVNRFEFRVESNWNERIEGAYGVIRLLNKSEQTASNAIRAGRAADFSTFIDLTGHETEGEAEGIIQVFFDEGSREFPITVNLTYGVDAAQEQPGVFSFQLNQVTALYATLLLLVVINVLLLFRKKKE